MTFSFWATEQQLCISLHPGGMRCDKSPLMQLFEQGDCSSISGSRDSPTNRVEGKNFIRFLRRLLFIRKRGRWLKYCQTQEQTGESEWMTVLCSHRGLKKESNVGWHHGMSVKCKGKLVGMVILRSESLLMYAFIQ